MLLWRFFHYASWNTVLCLVSNQRKKTCKDILFRYFLMFLVWAATHTHLLWKEMSSYLCMPLGKQLFRMWKTHCSSNTPSSLCLGDTCSKQCDKTHQCLNKVPLWRWTKQHVSFRPCSNHQGGTQQPHSYTHHLSQSSNTNCTIESSSVGRCGLLSSVLFWQSVWKKAFQRPGGESNFPVNRAEEKQRNGALSEAATAWRDTERESEEKPSLTCLEN